MYFIRTAQWSIDSETLMAVNYLYTLNERCGEFMLVCGEDSMTYQT